MSNTINPTISPEPTYTDKLFSAFADVESLFFVAVPLGFLCWSFPKTLTYYKDNESFHTGIKDSLDKKVFQKIIVPLYDFITNDLTAEISEDIKNIPSKDKLGFLKECDKKKIKLLEARDFTYLEKAIEFQEAIDKIIRTKKDQLTLKKLIKWNRKSLLVLTIISFILLILGIALVYSQKVNRSENISINLLIIWTFFLVVCVIFFTIYWFLSIKIDGFNYE